MIGAVLYVVTLVLLMGMALRKARVKPRSKTARRRSRREEWDRKTREGTRR